jgi:hypothetical protein
MKIFGSIHYTLGAVFAAAVVCATAWPADNGDGTPQPAAAHKLGTVTTEEPGTTSSPETVPKEKEPSKELSVRHEAVMDSGGNVADETIVKQTPPEPKKESRASETHPDENSEWVPGYWKWDAEKNNYTWVPGTRRRTIPGMKWSPGRWITVPSGYEWSPGHWYSESVTTKTAGDTRETVIVREAPPALKEEVQPPPTGAGLVWIPGYWNYQGGGYAWIPGRWDRPLAENMVWVRPYWYRGAAGYAFIAGHWDYPAGSRVLPGPASLNE